MKNFFGMMKNEIFYWHEAEFKTLDGPRRAMEEYIVYYNTKRITEKLKGLTPVAYRCQSLAKKLFNFHSVQLFWGRSQNEYKLPVFM